MTKLCFGLVILALLSPIGLLLPRYFKAKNAWGEWDSQTLKESAGYIPRGFEKLSSLWKAPMPDYALNGLGEKPLIYLSIDYITSAIIGVFICIGIIFILGKFLRKKE